MKKLLLFLILFFSKVTHVSAKIFINEVYPKPQDSELEWVELYNSSSQSASLNDWTLEDHLSSPSTIYRFKNQVVESLDYLIIELSKPKLNNSADGLTLKNALGQNVDEMSYSGSQIGESWSRVDDNWILGTSSPAEDNPWVNPSPRPSPSHSPSPNSQYQVSNIELSEISPCPNSGDSEWIEIFNNSKYLINLVDWKVRDASDNTKKVSLTVNANSLAVISWSSSLLNNSGDTVILESPDNQQAFAVVFPRCKQKGSSFIYHDNNWQETKTATKGSSNIYTALTSSEEKTSKNTNSEKQIIDNSWHALADTAIEHEAFVPPIKPEGLILGTSIEKKQKLENQDPEESKNLRDSRNAIASAILGGLLLISSSGYKLYEYYQQNIPKL